MEIKPVFVLYVDENKAFCDEFLEFAKQKSILADSCAGFHEAKKIYTPLKYDCVIAGFFDDDKEWIEFIRNTRENNDKTPFILFTKSENKSLIIEALNAGFDYYLKKDSISYPLFDSLSEKVNFLVKKNQKEVLNLETRKGTLFYNMPVPFVLISLPEVVFAEVNDLFLKSTGYSRDEVVGKSPPDFDFFVDMDDYYSMIQTLRKKGYISGIELRFRMKSGEIRMYRFFSRVITVEKKAYVISTVEDITELKASEKSFQMLVSGMSGTSGRASLNRITKELSTYFDADCVILGEYMPGYKRINAISMYLDNKLILNKSFSLKGTLCEELLEKEYCINPDCKSSEFYIEDIVDTFCVRGYLGSVLYAKDGRNLGVICILSRKKLKVPPYSREIIDIFSSKASGEIERLHALEELSESERKFRTLVEYSLGGILILDFNGNVLFANESARRIVFPEDCTDVSCSANVMDFIAPASREDVLLDFEKVSQGTDGYIAQYLLNTVKGEERWIESIGKAITFEGSPAILISMGDITGRKKIEMALKDEITRRRILQDQSRDGIVILREDGSVFEVNESFANMLGYSIDDVKKMYVWDWNNTSPDYIVREMLKIVDKKGDHFETRHIRKDGTEIDVDISTTAAIFSGEKLILCICRDITSWKNSERALISVNKKLNLLSYITCHDISNKANGLEIFISLLDENQLNSDMRPYLDEAKKAVHSIMHQIEFTREYEKVGVKEPLWISLEKITEGLFDANVCLNFNCKGVFVYADAMLEKVFYNLFDNTLRHAKSAAVVDINCRKTDESNLVIIWEDNGPGIEDSKKEEIFKRGYGKNTGFGLFLAREILDITKITICETGVFGEGARFEMSVPMGGYKIKDSDER